MKSDEKNIGYPMRWHGAPLPKLMARFAPGASSSLTSFGPANSDQATFRLFYYGFAQSINPLLLHRNLSIRNADFPTGLQPEHRDIRWLSNSENGSYVRNKPQPPTHPIQSPTTKGTKTTKNTTSIPLYRSCLTSKQHSGDCAR